MIDEMLLTRALDDAASAYDEPIGGREAILAAAAAPRWTATESAGVRRPWWRRPLPVAGAVVGLWVVVALAVTVPGTTMFHDGSVSRAPSSGGADDGAAPDGFVNFGGSGANTDGGSVPAPVQPQGTAPRPNPAPLAATDGDSVAGSGSGSVSGGAPAPAQPAPAGAQAALAKVVKTGSVEIVVADGKVPATLARLETLVAGSRGYVADSKTQETGDAPSGVVTMRVPGTAYEAMLGRVRALGEVRTATSSGEDVTAAFVDTEARLKTLRETKAVYDTLLARARSIGEVLAVQQQINGAQTQIEQLEGKLKVLKDQVAYATLTVSVFEESDDLVTLAEPGRISSAWDRAKDNFGDGLEWVIAASGTVALLVLAGALLLAGGLGARRLLRRRLI